MKEIYMLVGFGAGLVTGMLLYEHSQEAKKLVSKGENAIKEEMESIKETISGPNEKKKQKSKA